MLSSLERYFLDMLYMIIIMIDVLMMMSGKRLINFLKS